MQALLTLRRLITEVPSRLARLPDSAAARKPSPNKWSPKEHLGHLLDSAAHHHQRLIRAQLEDNPNFPAYDRDRWVELQKYQDRDWKELIEAWRVLNRQVLGAVESAPAPAWQRTCTIAGLAPQTLQFTFEQYVDHLFHHLKHIGMEVADIREPVTENRELRTGN